MKLYQCLFEGNPCYKAGQTIKPEGIVIHSTGADNRNLKRYVQPTYRQTQHMGVVRPKWQPLTRYDVLVLLGTNINQNDWNRVVSPGKCVHAFIGTMFDGTVATWQALPWNMRCWGSGSGTKGSYNNTHIQFEICEDKGDGIYLTKVYREAAELCAYLCDLYDLPVSSIRSHAEANLDGYATNHGDPDHWFKLFGLSMDGFRRDVQQLLDGKSWEEVTDVVYNTLEELPEYAKPTISKLVEAGHLKGSESGLSLSKDMVRILVILDRAGVFDI